MSEKGLLQDALDIGGSVIDWWLDTIEHGVFNKDDDLWISDWDAYQTETKRMGFMDETQRQAAMQDMQDKWIVNWDTYNAYAWMQEKPEEDVNITESKKFYDDAMKSVSSAKDWVYNIIDTLWGMEMDKVANGITEMQSEYEDYLTNISKIEDANKRSEYEQKLSIWRENQIHLITEWSKWIAQWKDTNTALQDSYLNNKSIFDSTKELDYNLRYWMISDNLWQAFSDTKQWMNNWNPLDFLWGAYRVIENALTGTAFALQEEVVRPLSEVLSNDNVNSSFLTSSELGQWDKWMLWKAMYYMPEMVTLIAGMVWPSAEVKAVEGASRMKQILTRVSSEWIEDILKWDPISQAMMAQGIDSDTATTNFTFNNAFNVPIAVFASRNLNKAIDAMNDSYVKPENGFADFGMTQQEINAASNWDLEKLHALQTYRLLNWTTEPIIDSLNVDSSLRQWIESSYTTVTNVVDKVVSRQASTSDTLRVFWYWVMDDVTDDWVKNINNNAKAYSYIENSLERGNPEMLSTYNWIILANVIENSGRSKSTMIDSMKSSIDEYVSKFDAPEYAQAAEIVKWNLSWQKMNMPNTPWVIKARSEILNHVIATHLDDIPANTRINWVLRKNEDGTFTNIRNNKTYTVDEVNELLPKMNKTYKKWWMASVELSSKMYEYLNEVTKWVINSPETYNAFVKRMYASYFDSMSSNDYLALKALAWNKAPLLDIWSWDNVKRAYTYKWGILDIEWIDIEHAKARITQMAKETDIQTFINTLNNISEWTKLINNFSDAVVTANWKLSQIPKEIVNSVKEILDWVTVAYKSIDSENLWRQYLTQSLWLRSVDSAKLTDNVDNLNQLGVTKPINPEAIAKKQFDNVYNGWKSIDSCLYRNMPERWKVSYIRFSKVDTETKALLDKAIEWKNVTKWLYVDAQISKNWKVGVDKWIKEWNEFLLNANLRWAYTISPDSHGKPIWKQIEAVNPSHQLSDVSIHIPVIAFKTDEGFKVFTIEEYFTKTWLPFGWLQNKTNFKWKHVTTTEEIKFATRDVLSNITDFRWDINVEDLYETWKTSKLFNEFMDNVFEKYWQNVDAKVVDLMEWKWGAYTEWQIQMFGNMDFWVFWHEFGHHIENNIPENLRANLEEMYDTYYSNEFENFSEFFAEYYSQAFIRMESFFVASPNAMSVLIDTAKYIVSTIVSIMKNLYIKATWKELTNTIDDYAKWVFDAMVRDSAFGTSFDTTQAIVNKLWRLSTGNTITNTVNSMTSLVTTIMEDNKLHKLINANKDVAAELTNELIRIASKWIAVDYAYAWKLSAALESASDKVKANISSDIKNGNIWMDLFMQMFKVAYENPDMAPKMFDEFYLQYRKTVNAWIKESSNKTVLKINSFIKSIEANIKTNRFTDFVRNVKILTTDVMDALNSNQITVDEADALFWFIRKVTLDFKKLKSEPDRIAFIVNHRHLFEETNTLISSTKNGKLKQLTWYHANKMRSLQEYMMNTKWVKNDNNELPLKEYNNLMLNTADMFIDAMDISKWNAISVKSILGYSTLDELRKWVELIKAIRDIKLSDVDEAYTFTDKEEKLIERIMEYARKNVVTPMKEEWGVMVRDMNKYIDVVYNKIINELEKDIRIMEVDSFITKHPYYSYGDNQVFIQPWISHYGSATWIHGSIDNISRSVFGDKWQWSKWLVDKEALFQTLLKNTQLSYNTDLNISLSSLRYNLSLLWRLWNVSRVMLWKLWLWQLDIPINTLVLRKWFNTSTDSLDAQAIKHVVSRILFTASGSSDSKYANLVGRWNDLITNTTYIADDLMQNINRTTIPGTILADYLWLSGKVRKDFLKWLESETWYSNYIVSMLQTYVKWNWLYDTMQMLPKIDAIHIQDLTRNSEDVLAKDEWRSVREKTVRTTEWIEWEYEEHIRWKFNKMMDIGDYTKADSWNKRFNADWEEDVLEKEITEFSLKDFNQYFISNLIKLVNETETSLVINQSIDINAIGKQTITKEAIPWVPFNWSLLRWHMLNVKPDVFNGSLELSQIRSVTESTYTNDLAFDLKQAFTSTQNWESFIKNLQTNWIQMHIRIDWDDKLSEAVWNQLYKWKLPPAKFVSYIAEKLTEVNRWLDTSVSIPNEPWVINITNPDVVRMFDVVFTQWNKELTSIQYTSRNWYQAPWFEKMVANSQYKKRWEMDSFISIVSGNEFYEPYFSGKYKYSFSNKLWAEKTSKWKRAIWYGEWLQWRVDTLKHYWRIDEAAQLEQAANAYIKWWRALQWMINKMLDEDINPEFNEWLNRFSEDVNQFAAPRYRDTAYTRLLQSKWLYEKSRIVNDFDEWFVCEFWWDD